MKGTDISIDETYLFLATDSPARKHLEGMAFTVVRKELVYRRLKKGTRKTYRYFNDDGVGARAEELQPLPDRESPCSKCAIGEMQITGTTPRASETATHYECDNCQHTETFP